MSVSLRWDPYFLARGEEVPAFWSDLARVRDRKVLYILGRGFDPRTTKGVEVLMSSEFDGSCDCLVVNMRGFDDGGPRPLVRLSNRNFDSLASLISGRGTVSVAEVDAWSGDGDTRTRTGPDRALRLVSRETLSSYTDVVLDVSALPRGLYFPLLARLVALCSPGDDSQNLHIFVAEDPALDSRIEESGLDEDAYFVPPFRSAMELESAAPVVWFPILGEKQNPQVEMVQTLVRQKAQSADVEVCPVLPLPARDPRRADCLIRQYSEFLASSWENDSRNFVYVAEQNPFQAYRQLVHSARQYNGALRSVGGCRVVISAHSSKLLSVGATLAAIELKAGGLKVGLANVDATSYQVSDPTNDPFQNTGVVPHLISLAGDAYEV